jgi:hypothetical protein
MQDGHPEERMNGAYLSKREDVVHLYTPVRTQAQRHAITQMRDTFLSIIFLQLTSAQISAKLTLLTT